MPLYKGLGETYARSGDFGQVQQKHEIFGNVFLGKERRGEQGGMGQESGIIQISLSAGQYSKQAWVEWVKKQIIYKYPCHLSRYLKFHSGRELFLGWW